MIRALRLAVLLLVAVVLLAGCPKKDEGAKSDPDTATIVVKADSEGLLLTWIDEKGEFHVEQKVADVPLTGRDAVRVVDPNRDEGTSSDQIFVADLRQARPDGTFPVSVMTRADFEKLAVARREKNGPTLANANAPPEATGSVQKPTPGGAKSAEAARPTVIIYGAEWCNPCKQTKAYLSQRGISYVEKDVDDPANLREVQTKLANAGRRFDGTIPVLDVRGRLLIGFDPPRIEEALGKAL